MGGKGCEFTVVVFYILSTLSGALKSIHCSRQKFLGLKISICSLALYSGSKVTRLLLETFESKDTSCHVGNHYLYILYISLTAYGCFAFLGHHLWHKYSLHYYIKGRHEKNKCEHHIFTIIWIKWQWIVDFYLYDTHIVFVIYIFLSFHVTSSPIQVLLAITLATLAQSFT